MGSTAIPLDWYRSPIEVLHTWPVQNPLVMLHSCDGNPKWGRWTILAQPREWQIATTPQEAIQLCSRVCSSELLNVECFSEQGAIVLPAKAGIQQRTGVAPSQQRGSRPMPSRGQALHGNDVPCSDNTPSRARLAKPTTQTSIEPCKPDAQIPFMGGWIGGLSYDLGRTLEPAACTDRAPPTRWPLAAFAWCPNALVFDHVEQKWWRVGGDAPELNRMQQIARTGCTGFVRSALRAMNTDDEHLRAIERAIEYIRAGDIFQANITRRYDARIEGSPRTLAAAAFETASPRYGAYLELPGERTVISISPELFLQFDAHTREVVTRPIKGTRSTDDDALDLWSSAKDAAELHMIVDLMRNDLGRVCEYGSVRVLTSRAIETHPTVHHGVAEIIGCLRAEVNALDLIKAAFPAGSITGAPKIRAMQIIEELEPPAREWYCGSIGFVDIRGNMTLNVAIRTMMLERVAVTSGAPESWSVRYGAGGGIVADSKPEDELRECDQKTTVLRAALRELSSQGKPLTIST